MTHNPPIHHFFRISFNAIQITLRYQRDSGLPFCPYQHLNPFAIALVIKMAQPTFCCDNIKPYPRSSRTDHDEKFDPFIKAASDTNGNDSSSSTAACSESDPSPEQYPYVIQFVKQVNYGPVESKQFFAPAAPTNASGSERKRYIELSEEDLIAANFVKVNTYKNFRCSDHNRFFELNLYQKDPVNKHHWRLNIARPSREIDL